MYHISYFLLHVTVESQICHGTERVWHMNLFFFIPLSLSYLFHLLPQLFTAFISTLSHISFFFSFSYSPPPSPLSHTLSSSLSPFVRSLLSILSLTLPICCSLLLRVANSRISKSLISSLFYLRVADLLFAILRVAKSLFSESPKSCLPLPILCSISVSPICRSTSTAYR